MSNKLDKFEILNRYSKKVYDGLIDLNKILFSRKDNWILVEVIGRKGEEFHSLHRYTLLDRLVKRSYSDKLAILRDKVSMKISAKNRDYLFNEYNNNSLTRDGLQKYLSSRYLLDKDRLILMQVLRDIDELSRRRGVCN